MQTSLSQAVLEKPVVIVSVALALLAAAGGMMWTNIAAQDRAQRPVMRPSVAVLTTVVAVSDIARGQVLSAHDLSAKEVTRIPTDGLARSDQAQGHIALADIKAGAPILATQISAAAAVGISTRVPAGLRAYAIAVSEAEIAGGFVQPGDHVDLYVTLPGALFAGQPGAARQNDLSKSTLLLSGVSVLAVGTKLETDGSANTAVRTVTLALQPQDLTRVALASRLGAITFAIRNPAETGSQAPSLADLGAVVGDFDSRPPVGAKRAVPGIPMLAGASRTTLHP